MENNILILSLTLLFVCVCVVIYYSNKKDISEPVLSIVKIFKENPKRFVLIDGEDYIYSRSFFIADTVTNETFIVWYNNYQGYSLKVSPMVLTEAEEKYLIEELLLPCLKRKGKYYRILEERKNLQERRRLTKIYKEK